jgi:predicted secreted hydrolase
VLIIASWATVAAGSTLYPPVVPGYVLQFPADEGAHPDFRSEWWYVTGWLEDASGWRGGFQVTFFRARPGWDENNPSRFAARQLLFAHAAVSDPAVGRLLKGEKSSRAGFGLAEAAVGKVDVVIDNWRLYQSAASRYQTTVTTQDFSLALELRATAPPLLQGDRGFSQKSPSPSYASYYYSLPQLTISGQVTVQGRTRTVTGTAWFDHEWSSSALDAESAGWDWVGLHGLDGSALMGLRIRNRIGREYYAAATWRTPSPTTPRDAAVDLQWKPLRRWRSPRTGIEYVVEWELLVGDRRFVLKPLFDDQENDTRGSTGTIYWEGAVEVLDDAGKLWGRGYLELTGYGNRLRF